jgi:hypothetical protein
MSYIGRGVDAISNVEKLDNITFDGSATYALTKSSAAFTPVGANNILVSIDGVIQQGNFSVSTTNIVFDWSPTSSNTCNFILHYGTGVLNVPADGSVSLAKMASNSVDSNQYVDGSIDAVHLSANSVDSDAYVDASIDNAHLADDAVGVAELSATGTASSSTFLRGDNAWAAAGGGKLLQAVQDTHTAIATITTATFVPFSASLAVTITPASTSNKVLLLVSLGGVDGQDYSWLDIQRAISGGATTVNISGATYGMSGSLAAQANRFGQSYMYLDSPSTTSAITYSPTGRDDEGSHTVSINRNGSTSSQIIAMEIEG